MYIFTCISFRYIMYESICNISSIKGKDLLLHFSVSLALSIYLSFPQSLSVYVSGSLFLCLIVCLSVGQSVSLSPLILSITISVSFTLLSTSPHRPTPFSVLREEKMPYSLAMKVSIRLSCFLVNDLVMSSIRCSFSSRKHTRTNM